MTTDAGSNPTRAYSDRIGLIANSPNFPAAWDQVVGEEVRRLQTNWVTIRSGSANPGATNSLLPWPILCVPLNVSRLGLVLPIFIPAHLHWIASTVATLDERSGGRILLGLGPSGANVIEHWHGVPFQKPVQRTREYVEIIRMILRGEKLVYNGEIFHIRAGFQTTFYPSTY